MIELNNLIKISKYAGERFDLVQSGGGNSSAKMSNGEMFIKASGFFLSEIEKNVGYATINNTELLSYLDKLVIPIKKDDKNRADNIINKVNLTKNIRPSIETYLHAYTRKYTLHTHPITVNILLCRKNWRELVKNLFEDCLCVPYATPGIDLAIEILFSMKQADFNKDNYPKLIFLQNHGLIVNSNDSNEVIELTEYVTNIIEKELNLDYDRYRNSTKVSKLINKISDEILIAHTSNDNAIIKCLKSHKSILFKKPFCPDTLVYCGFNLVEIENLNSLDPLINYRKKYNSLPKVILYKDVIYLLAKNLKKAKEIEDVLRFHVLVSFQNLKTEINNLSDDEMSFLDNWDAEKFRQDL